MEIPVFIKKVRKQRRHVFPHTISEAVRRFFMNNPGEELTYDDMCLKFDISRKYAQRIVYRLSQEGLVESTFVIRPAPARARS